jgi:hypothetical protein
MEKCGTARQATYNTIQHRKDEIFMLDNKEMNTHTHTHILYLLLLTAVKNIL